MSRFFYFNLNDVGDLLGDNPAGEVGLAAGAEGDLSGGDGEKSVVTADAHIFPSLDLRTALADDDHTRAGGGTVSELHSEVFRV